MCLNYIFYVRRYFTSLFKRNKNEEIELVLKTSVKYAMNLSQFLTQNFCQLSFQISRLLMLSQYMYVNINLNSLKGLSALFQLLRGFI